MTETAKINGLPELHAKLAAIPRALRVRVLRNALSAGARIIRNIAQAGAPVLKPSRFKSPYRTAGTLKKAIRVRTSRRDKAVGDVGVFVNVKPLPAGQASAKNPHDPFYWRFQEFGWTPASKGTTARTRRLNVKRGASPKVPGKFFLRAAAVRVGEALPLFERGMLAWFDKVESSGKVAP